MRSYPQKELSAQNLTLAWLRGIQGHAESERLLADGAMKAAELLSSSEVLIFCLHWHQN